MFDIKDREICDYYRNCLFLERIEKTTTIEKKTMDIEERGVRLRLTIVDTPGTYLHIYFIPSCLLWV